MTFAPTPEQQSCAEKFSTGKKLRINAYAGTGKTSTLKHLARSTNKIGTYLAFNKSIADEARKEFPGSVECKTTHAMAFRSMVKGKINPNGFSTEKMTGSVNGGFLQVKLGLRGRDLAPDLSVSARGWGYLIGETVKKFQRSGEDEVKPWHVPLDGKLGQLPAVFLNPAKESLVREAARVWERMIDPKSDLPLGHDGYLKLWALGKPQIDCDYLLLDEAQDTNGVVLELMRHQQSQVIAVGDRHQQIYEWRGAKNAMVELPCELEARLSTSFRFGPRIAGYATEILTLLGETVPLKGNPDRGDKIGSIEKPDAILFRTNARLIEEVMRRISNGETPCVIGGVSDLLTLVNATEKLQAGQPVESPLDFFGFKNWTEVVVAAQSDEARELKSWVDLVEANGTEALRSAFEKVSKVERVGQVTLSTAHKSKGREWDKVRLSDDLLLGVPLKNGTGKGLTTLPDAELRLYYVAATRGKVELEVDEALSLKLDVIKQFIADQREAAE